MAEFEDATLAYEYEIGDVVTYDFTMVQNLVAIIDLDATPGILGEADLPDEIDISLETTGELTYFINPADDPESYEVAISGVITGTSVTGRIDGQAVNDVDDLPIDFGDPDSVPDVDFCECSNNSQCGDGELCMKSCLCKPECEAACGTVDACGEDALANAGMGTDLETCVAVCEVNRADATLRQQTICLATAQCTAVDACLQ